MFFWGKSIFHINYWKTKKGEAQKYLCIYFMKFKEFKKCMAVAMAVSTLGPSAVYAAEPVSVEIQELEKTETVPEVEETVPGTEGEAEMEDLPETEIPETGIPETETPETPNVDVPEEDAEEVPEIEAPEVPEEGIPEETIPDEPETETPENETPESE